MSTKSHNNVEKILNFYEKSEVFKNLSKDDLYKLAENSEFYDFKKGDIVFEKGNRSRHFYIISQGEIAISSTADAINFNRNNNEGAIARFIEGEIFGEFEFFEEDPRTAYALATEETTLLTFPRTGINLDQLFEKYSRIFAQIYHSLISINSGRQRHAHKLISEKTEWIEELKKQMFFDKLTSVYNRTYLEDELSRNFSHLGSTFSLIVIKPDNFKLINDTFGHEAGDLALQSISSKIQSLLRKDDLAIRYRGNEFIIVFPNIPLTEAISLGNQYHKEMNAFDIGSAMKKESLFQTFSVGISSYPEHETDFLELVEKAFTSVFDQREIGGNGVKVATEGEQKLYMFLKSVGMFSDLKMSELHLVSQHLDLLHFNTNDIIFKEKELGDELYIIKSGSTSVRIKVQDGTEKEIALLKSGEFFGEMAIFDDAPRSATCIAAEDCEILSLNKNDFFNLMKLSPHAAINVMKTMLNKTTDRLNASGQFITQMVKWGEDASQRAVTDKLTGVFNRRFLESELNNLFNKCQENGSPLSLVMADMDYFREINEGYSHEVGDRYIVEVAKVFKETYRECDIVSRYGGDEFTILLPDTDIETAMNICELVRQNVEKLNFLDSIDGPDLHPSISLGVSNYPSTCKTLALLTEQADKALYEAKNSGRNRVVSFKD